MEYPNPKIRFYRERTFGEKLNITFDYLRENWRPLLRFSLYLILPLCLIQSFFLNRFMVNTLTDLPSEGDFVSDIFPILLSQIVGLFCCYIAGYILLSALIYGLMQTYERRDGGLRGIAFSEFSGTLLRMSGRSLSLMLFGLFIGILLGAAVAAPAFMISSWTLLVSLPLLCIVLLLIASPMWLFPPLYLLGGRPFFPALGQSFRWGFRAWFEVFGLMIVFGLIGGIVNMITYLPWSILTFIGQDLSLVSDVSLMDTFWYQLASYILGIIQSYGYYISQVIALTGIAFEYFHLREKHEGITAHADIASFSQL